MVISFLMKLKMAGTSFDGNGMSGNRVEFFVVVVYLKTL